MHPSYEDRPGAPDRVFACARRRDVRAPGRARGRARSQRAGAADADVLHLHHLTPINEAAARVAPDVPVVGHLHGTELLMLEAIERDPAAGRTPRPGPSGCAAGPRACERLIVLSDTPGRARRSGCSTSTPSAACASPTASTPKLPPAPRRPTARSGGARSSRSRAAGRPASEAGQRALRGAATSRRSGRRDETPVLLYVGRFTEVKRLPLLIEAYARARPGFARRAPLVLVGGYPGEWEGEHPLETIRARRRPGRLPRRLARPRRAAGLPRRHRRPRAAVGARAVRPGAGRGDGLRAAGDRGRRPRPGRDRRATARPAGSSSPTTAPRSPTRSSRPSTAPTSAAAAARRAARTPRERYAWPALARDVAAVYDASLATVKSARRRIMGALQPARGATSLRTNALEWADPETAHRNSIELHTSEPPGCYLSAPPRAHPGPPHVAEQRPTSAGSASTTRPTSTTPAASRSSRSSMRVPTARDRRARDRRAGEPRASRRGRRRPEHRRRRGHPAPAARRVHARRLRRGAAAARRLRRLRVLPPARGRAPRGAERAARAHGRRRGPAVVGWRDVPVDKDYVGITANLFAAVRQAARSSAASDELATDQDAFERKLYVIRRAAGDRAPGPELVIPSLSAPHDRLQGDAHAPAAARRSTPTCRTRGPSRRSRSCTRASPRTRSRPGSARTRTGSSRTTARSTRCAATSTGCARASRSSRRELFGEDLPKVHADRPPRRLRLRVARQRGRVARRSAAARCRTR